MRMSEADRPLVDGRFQLMSRLGSGGMGTVWRARDTALDREVALKEVRPPDPAAEEARPGLTAQLRARAVREARALARLSDPHVVTIHHIVEPPDGSPPWIVMELVEGSSVYDRLAHGPMPVPEVIRLGREVLSALRAAHSAGIRHRDVKPANVLLRAGGGAVLTDFGIAVLDESTSRLTSTGDLIGSPEFIAPERVRGEEGNPASDLWSLGMLLYVAAEGHHPLRRATSLATVVAVLDDPIPPPVRSGALAPVLGRLLVRDPAARPDGAELERLLAGAAAEETGGHRPVPGPGGHPSAPGPEDHRPVPGPGGYRPAPGAGSVATAPSAGSGPDGRETAPGPVPAPYGSHPAYGSSAPTWAPGGGTGAVTPPHGVFGPPAPAARSRRPLLLGLASAAVVAAAAVGALNWFPGDGPDGRTGAGDPGTASATGGVPGAGRTGSTGRATGGAGSGTDVSAGERPGRTAVTGNTLLTPANVRTVLRAFREASGNTRVKRVTFYPEYALAEIPTAPGATTYDRYEFRDGAARKTGPGGTIAAGQAAEQPFDPAGLAWDELPGLMGRGERELKVENPTTRYLLVDRWTFNDDRPSLRFYLSNAYQASGYLLADGDGTVVRAHPAG
ncbi:protein kinase [Streptomyces sp. LP05-1]|uniref:non-specific serine/threonine protein kinase n=1 Tax=Streptomyces pyxinae TaxID=2970734 RepID=A0ABT2CIU8_9ACTN|nr:protein kinase [Streptomyces sp. LP05-1]MCS0637022.1 protein kinase [Streptomyces sp. LP05-1]